MVTSTIALCGIKFFCDDTIKRKFPVTGFVRARHDKKLPLILSRKEVWVTLSQVKVIESAPFRLKTNVASFCIQPLNHRSNLGEDICSKLPVSPFGSTSPSMSVHPHISGSEIMRVNVFVPFGDS